MKSRAYGEYVKDNDTRAQVLSRHYDGKPPSEIDTELGLLPGESKRIVVNWWKCDTLYGGK